MRPDDTAPDGAVLIPLYARNGAIRGHTVVDAADADFARQWTWRLSNWGYAVRSEACHACPPRKHTIRLHRELLGLVEGDGLEGDHKDRDRLNNRRSNLRKITHNGNKQNRSSKPGTSSRFRGVTWDKTKGRWQAQIKVNRRYMFLGRFDSEIEAAEAARAARLKHMPYSVESEVLEAV